MITRYEAASHEIVGEGEERKDVFGLELRAYKMPVVKARKATFGCHVSKFSSEVLAHKESVRHVALNGGDESDWSNATATFDVLMGKCPYCGIEEELQSNRWRIYADRLGDHADTPSAHILVCNEEAEDDPGRALRSFSGLPEEWMPFHDGVLVPTDALESVIEKPCGDTNPVEAFEADMRQPRLPFFDSKYPRWGNEYGRSGGYKGIYECSHCGESYYVVFNEFDLSGHVDNPDAWEPSSATSHLYGKDVMQAVVIAGDDFVEVRFTPAVDGRVKRIRFNIGRGYTEVDGFQIMKKDNRVISDLARLPLGFSCPELFSRISTLFRQKVAGAKKALELIGESRRASAYGVKYGSGVNVADFAFACRLQGYPDEFYRNLFLKSRLRRLIVRNPVIAPFETLPVTYEEIPRSFDVSGLPSVKSVRRMAFKQPLLISYSQSLTSIPFEDSNLLVKLFSEEAVFHVLEELRHSFGEIEVFAYLKSTRGETATWEYLKSLIDGDGFFDVIAYGGDSELLTDDLENALARLSIDKAAQVLQGIFASCGGCERGIQDEYCYVAEQRQLEGCVSDFDFVLPSNPLALIVAGAELGNCLASYIDRIDEGHAIVIATRKGRPEGAIEVETSKRKVVQAKARYNKRLSGNVALRAAFSTWLEEKGLVYAPEY